MLKLLKFFGLFFGILFFFISCSQEQSSSSNSLSTLPQTQACKKYVECYKAIFKLNDVEQMFGTSAPCWKAGVANANTCDEGCKSGLQLLTTNPKFESEAACK